MLAQTVICEFITIVDDLLPEPVEQFFADLSSTDPAVRFQIQTTTIVIEDNDREPALELNS